ncbi:xanthine dehydrogenase accessory factor [Ardenticatena maritima]|uniref:Xanthine dehydrogenase accessory factor n=1 Tax=Ardenticatena maritima TaxID=872965 RepID=A0A0N0RFQ2_9CHLR|nr:XdhC family protein [Ardenticatena maritima]GAP63777.1 xanthine dehydrogenase accessory factor [Ardenticatena maritima]
MPEDDLRRALYAAIQRREPVARVVLIAGPEPLVGRQALVWLQGDPLGALGLPEAVWAQVVRDARIAIEQRRHTTQTYALDATTTVQVFMEVIGRPPTLLIVGAGHIAQPLAQVGALCDFRVIVVDDRPAYARPDRFPTADEVLAIPFDDLPAHVPLDRDTYVVLVTRGHQHDVDVLLRILDAPLAYIGMIGSRRRIQGVFALLKTTHHLTDEQLSRVYAPIGLDIGAETPAEIAVAIMGEIILVRRGGTGRPLSDALWVGKRRVHVWRTQRNRGTGDAQ